MGFFLLLRLFETFLFHAIAPDHILLLDRGNNNQIIIENFVVSP